MLNWFVASASFEDFQRSLFIDSIICSLHATLYSESQLSWSLINHVNCTPLYLKVSFYIEHLIIISSDQNLHW